MRLAILEDNANFAYLVINALKDLIADVVICETWEELLRLIDDREVAWIDLRLSEEVRENESIANLKKLRVTHPDLIIVIGSGFVTPEIHAKLNAIGIDAVFQKSAEFSPEQVGSMILNAIMRASMRAGPRHRKLLEKALEWMHFRFPEAVP